MLKFRKRSLADYIMYSLITVIGIVIDQVTKLLAVTYLKPIGVCPIIDGVVQLHFTTNPGMAFGLAKDHRWVFMTASVIMIAAMGIYLFGGLAENRLYAVSVAMVLSGGIGNMIDRIALGSVIDFIEVTFVDFAIFNGADSFVCVGAGMLVLAMVLDIIKEAKSAKEQKK